MAKKVKKDADKMNIVRDALFGVEDYDSIDWDGVFITTEALEKADEVVRIAEWARRSAVHTHLESAVGGRDAWARQLEDVPLTLPPPDWQP